MISYKVPPRLVASHNKTALAQHAEGWMFQSQPQQTQVMKTGSDNSTTEYSAIGVSVTGPRRWPLLMDAPCHSKCGTLKNPHCAMAMSASIG